MESQLLMEDKYRLDELMDSREMAEEWWSNLDDIQRVYYIKKMMRNGKNAVERFCTELPLDEQEERVIELYQRVWGDGK